jgi:hypothetical protein
MLRKYSFQNTALLTATLILLSSPAFADEACDLKASDGWPEITNNPVGHYLPEGATVDIVGIPLGSSYDVACAALAEYAKGQPLDWSKSGYNVTGGSAGGRTVLEWPNGLSFRPSRRDPEAQWSSEQIGLRFTAPASGSQLVGASRHLSFFQQDKQPLIADFLAQLSNRFGGQPSKGPHAATRQGITYVWVLNENGMVTPDRFVGAQPDGCNSLTSINPNSAAQLNQNGVCDVYVELYVDYGVTTDHARQIRYTIAGVQRYKDNTAADFRAVEQYSDSLRGSGAAAPKL